MKSAAAPTRKTAFDVAEPFSLRLIPAFGFGTLPATWGVLPAETLAVDPAAEVAVVAALAPEEAVLEPDPAPPAADGVEVEPEPERDEPELEPVESVLDEPEEPNPMDAQLLAVSEAAC